MNKPLFNQIVKLLVDQITISEWQISCLVKQYIINYRGKLFLMHSPVFEKYAISYQVSIHRLMLTNLTEDSLLIFPLYNIKVTLDTFAEKPLIDSLSSYPTQLKVIFWSGIDEEQIIKKELCYYIYGIIIGMTDRKTLVKSYSFTQKKLEFVILALIRSIL